MILQKASSQHILRFALVLGEVSGRALARVHFTVLVRLVQRFDELSCGREGQEGAVRTQWACP